MGFHTVISLLKSGNHGRKHPVYVHIIYNSLFLDDFTFIVGSV